MPRFVPINARRGCHSASILPEQNSTRKSTSPKPPTCYGRSVSSPTCFFAEPYGCLGAHNKNVRPISLKRRLHIARAQTPPRGGIHAPFANELCRPNYQPTGVDVSVDAKCTRAGSVSAKGGSGATLNKRPGLHEARRGGTRCDKALRRGGAGRSNGNCAQVARKHCESDLYRADRPNTRGGGADTR